MTWAVERSVGSAATFHARPLPDRPSRAVWFHLVDRPALVLGSTQDGDLADRAACRDHGVEVVRRRSGGGAVLVEPARTLWIDVVVPRHDPLWDDDVGRSALWLGDTWRNALAVTGFPGASVHRGPMVRRPWSELVCFAGLGPGEVTVGGAKLVGTSQRRTRSAARLQCAVHQRWEPERLLLLLRLDPAERTRAAAETAALATGVSDLAALGEAFLAALP